MSGSRRSRRCRRCRATTGSNPARLSPRTRDSRPEYHRSVERVVLCEAAVPSSCRFQRVLHVEFAIPSTGCRRIEMCESLKTTFALAICRYIPVCLPAAWPLEVKHSDVVRASGSARVPTVAMPFHAADGSASPLCRRRTTRCTCWVFGVVHDHGGRRQCTARRLCPVPHGEPAASARVGRLLRIVLRTCDGRQLPGVRRRPAQAGTRPAARPRRAHAARQRQRLEAGALLAPLRSAQTTGRRGPCGAAANPSGGAADT